MKKHREMIFSTIVWKTYEKTHEDVFFTIVNLKTHENNI